ncbi:hypothetical protein EKO23_06380 [Nocardioides guangzhouensis]|uniref:Peptidase S8/S53 domain-containing protein n=1 Tax=Nocardioides guangzhouensis TaxID=2497878 RepID=A0A4Q4ZGC7_9ACTN|nr:S8 family serine peptidase [Nocardioides guangzhouensis]RYP87232.1 hypothetical protein EKO23_06380 [Nocardioides guangzhouensis]
MPGLRPPAARLLAAGLLGAGLAASVAGPTAPAYAEGACVRDVPDAGEPVTYEKPNDRVATALRLPEAHRISNGRGVGVAVVDSGVDPATGMVDVRGAATVAGPGAIADAHGTIVAGLVAGNDRERGVLGVAPGAHVVPVRVTAPRPEGFGSSGEPPELTDRALAAGIDKAVALARTENIRVINLSLELDDASPAVQEAIDRATRRGILVVAAVGNRTADPDDEDDPDRYRPGEDEVRFPASYDDEVLAVTALDPDLDLDPTWVWTGPETDVSAPAVGAISVTVGGSTCAIGDVASSWATAQVSGLAALLFAQNPNRSPAQVATRIEATARGAYADDALDGHGMVQPLEALTAQLQIAKDGTLQRAPAYVEARGELSPPERPQDVAAESRRTMMWWGLGAGGLVLLGLLLRPLTARRP